MIAGLADRLVLVTGASSGIGAATAHLLARAGARVWITYAHDAAGAADTVRACEAAGAEVRCSRLDLRSPEQIGALVREIGAAWGGLHGLVNNAGTCPYTPHEAISTDEWDEVLETNARGTFLALRGALGLLRASDGDRAIVNVSSVAGQIGGVATSVHYAASKAAILAITRSYARLLAPEGIRVNAVAPGPIASGITGQLDEHSLRGLAGQTALGRLGGPDDVAPTVALLVSPASGFTTGATYDVNGGVRID